MLEATRADMEQNRVSDRHAYLPPEGRIIELGYDGLYVPLQPRKYGFIERTAVLPQRHYDFLSPKNTEFLSRYFNHPTDLMMLLNAIAFCVNDSMEYDTLKAGDVLDQRRSVLEKKLETSGKLTPNMKKKIKRRLHAIMDCHDIPSANDKAFKGICYDAGDRIRLIISTIEDNEPSRYMKVQTNPEIDVPLDDHDTTAIIDIVKGGWVVVNSKHMRVTEGLVPIGEYRSLGAPYGNGRIFRI